MNIDAYPFQTFDWNSIPVTTRAGETGFVSSQIVMVGNIRIRKVIYSPNYKADHWCSKGHIMYCIEGEMQTELDSGAVWTLSAGMSYIVGDNCEAHRSSTSIGCTLFVVD